MRLRKLVSVSALLCATAQAGEAWETVQKTPILVRERDRAGTRVKEIWAEAVLAAPVVDVQGALTDYARFPKFMPYITQTRELGASDGRVFVYSRLDLPLFLSPRDFIHEVQIDRDAKSDPDGAFENHWFAAPDKLAPQKGVIRLRVTEGSWLVTPLRGGRSHAVYRFSVDPGGSIPAVAANLGNTKGIARTLAAVEAEAQRRAKQRLEASRNISKQESAPEIDPH